MIRLSTLVIVFTILCYRNSVHFSRMRRDCNRMSRICLFDLIDESFVGNWSTCSTGSISALQYNSQRFQKYSAGLNIPTQPALVTSKPAQSGAAVNAVVPTDNIPACSDCLRKNEISLGYSHAQLALLSNVIAYSQHCTVLFHTYFFAGVKINYE